MHRHCKHACSPAGSVHRYEEEIIYPAYEAAVGSALAKRHPGYGPSISRTNVSRMKSPRS